MNLFGAVERNRELLDRERAQAMQVEEERQRRYALQPLALMGGRTSHSPQSAMARRRASPVPALTCWRSRRPPTSSRWKMTDARWACCSLRLRRGVR